MAFKEFKTHEWIQEIEHGLEYRRQYGVEDKWGELEAVYYNVHKSMMNDGPNILLSQGDSMLSSITVPRPIFLVSATSPEGVEAAPILESLDNKLLDALDMRTEVERAKLHAFLFGRGIVKIGYDSEWGYDPSLDVGGSLQLGLTLTQLDKRGTRRLEYDRTVKAGMPWVRAVPPHDIVVPWGTVKLDNTPWIAQRFVRHIDDLKADAKYINTRNLMPQLSMRDFVQSYRSTRTTTVGRTNTRDPEFVEMYEIHDRRTGKVFVVTADHNKFLRNQVDALQINNSLPYESIAFTPVSRAFWVTPDAFYLYFAQSELSDIAIQRTKQRRIATLKFLYDEDAIEESELAKILSPEVGTAAKVTGQRDLRKVIMKLENTPNPSLQGEEELLRANAREQIGFSRNQVGEFTGGRKTATEVQKVDQASKLRLSRRGLASERLYQGIIRRVNDLIFENWTLPRFVEVIGPQLTQKWIKVSGSQLKAAYNYSVKFTDQTEARGRKMEALQLYALLSKDPTVDAIALRQFLVGEFNDPEFGRIFDASIQSALQQSQLRSQGGDVQQGGGQRQQGIAQVPSLPGGNGQGNRTF